MELDQTIGGMIGKTIVRVNDVKQGAESVVFLTSDGLLYAFHHATDCSETVVVEDVCGDIADLIGSPLLQVEEARNKDETPTDPFTGAACKREPKCGSSDYDSQTWTFYKFATNKGSVTIRWLGRSNGYYSERVDLLVIRAGEKFSDWFNIDTQGIY